MSGFVHNVLGGILHAPEHVWQALTSPNSFVGRMFSGPLTKFEAYEKLHGEEQLEKAVGAGVAKFKEVYVPGKDGVSTALVAAVAAFFESGATDIKAYFTTTDAYAALAGPVEAVK